MGDVVLYGHQCRMARAAARLSREQLAVQSKVSVRTIAAFEHWNPRNITTANAMALRRALEEAGIQFTGFGIDLSNLPSHRAWMEKNQCLTQPSAA